MRFEEVLSTVRREIPRGEISVDENGANRIIIAKVKGGLFAKDKTLKLSYRQRLRPSHELHGAECPLTKNLMGMVGFVMNIPTAHHEVRNQLVYKIRSINTEMSFMAEPKIISEFEGALREILCDLDGIAFVKPNSVLNKSTTQYFADSNLNLILDQNGKSDIQELKVVVDSKYADQPQASYTGKQVGRKERSIQTLSAHQIKINKNLPCVADDSIVNIRSKEEVLDRLYALLVIAVKGEGVDQATINKFILDKNIKHFSPKENSLITQFKLSDTDKAYATWRYESYTALLWAAGLLEHLPFPSEICDVKNVVTILRNPSRSEMESTIELRSKAEILDQLDLHYRMNWACVDARIKGEQVTGNLNPSVVYERHYLLNWLTGYLGSDWDDVMTNT